MIEAPAEGLRLFVTATDTDAGKTRFTTLLLRALRGGDFPDAIGMKPLCSGSDGDLVAIEEACSGVLTRSATNFAVFKMAATPSVAASAEGVFISPEKLLEWCAKRSVEAGSAPLVCEGVGGWLVPIFGTWCVADWARALGWPVVLVVANRLGCLNHTLLTIREMRRHQVPLAGIVLNETTPPADPEASAVRASNKQVLEQDFGLDVLCNIRYGQEALTKEDVERILVASTSASQIR